MSSSIARSHFTLSFLHVVPAAACIYGSQVAIFILPMSAACTRKNKQSVNDCSELKEERERLGLAITSTAGRSLQISQD